MKKVLVYGKFWAAVVLALAMYPAAWIVRMVMFLLDSMMYTAAADMSGDSQLGGAAVMGINNQIKANLHINDIYKEWLLDLTGDI